ncbi:MAG: methyltransferase domain-containing protein [Beijerinckiaceae bacterium]|nr:methyltransferase domain-containing protein [Beijerinckiaceae bacterium]
MSFSPSWLALREPADHRARDQALADRLAAFLAAKEKPLIVDLGCGAGSNLRALAPRLGPKQDWVLVDYDPALLAAARERLIAWATHTQDDGDALHLSYENKTISVRFRQADLSQGLDAVLDPAPDCVTAAALFDLCSVDFIAQAARQIAQRGAAFFTVLTYDGQEEWLPPHEADHAVLSAFIAHQKTDKGFGVSAGPDAPRALQEAFTQAGYEVLEASTPWRLEAPDDRMLMAELANGIAHAATETGQVDRAHIAAWRDARAHATHAIIGHRDCLALPRL